MNVDGRHSRIAEMRERERAISRSSTMSKVDVNMFEMTFIASALIRIFSLASGLQEMY